MIKNHQKQTGSALFIAIIFIAITILGVLSYMALKTHFQTTNNDEETTTVNERAQAIEENTSNESNYPFTLKEMDVALTLPESLNDLIYKYDNDHNIAWFSTRSLTERYDECSTSGVAPPLGALNKTEGMYPDSPSRDNANGVLVKQFDGFYIGYVSPQSLCSKDQTTVPVELELFTKSFSSLKGL